MNTYIVIDIIRYIALPLAYAYTFKPLSVINARTHTHLHHMPYKHMRTHIPAPHAL